MNTAPHRRAPFEWAVMVIGCALAIVNVGLGLTLIAGLPSRTSTPTFDHIRNLMPITYWGVAFVSTGILALFAQMRWRMLVLTAAHAVAGLMCLFWSLSFIKGLINVNVSATGIWAYLGLGLTHWVLAATALSDAGEARDE